MEELRARRAEIRTRRKERMALELVTLVGEVGFASAGVKELTRRSKVSTRAFYETFSTKESCFALGLEIRATALLDRAERAFQAVDGPWETRAKAALTLIMEALAADPPYARACTMESLHAGPEAVAVLRAATARSKRIFELGGVAFPRQRVVGDSLDSMLVGGILQPIHGLLRDGTPERLPELVPVMLAFLAKLRSSEGAERQADR